MQNVCLLAGDEKAEICDSWKIQVYEKKDDSAVEM